jgi:serine/threonine protein phosphatase PrpC
MILVMAVAGLVVAVVAVVLVRELRGTHELAVKLPPLGRFFAEDDPDVTKVGPATQRAATTSPVTRQNPEPDQDDDSKEAPLTVYESDSEIGIDEPTGPLELILVSAVGHSDIGRRRRRNEDSYVLLPEKGLYVVADGMGGYAGGDVASRLAIETISKAFVAGSFIGEPNPSRPRRGNELVWSIEAANTAILTATQKNPEYKGMGTTVLAARFVQKKQRLFLGHVGDSRCYRLRAKQLTRITSDHTLGASGVTGPYAEHLSRALGIGPTVAVDLVVDTPRHGDVYMLCTDGLTKMVPDAEVAKVLAEGRAPQETVDRLIAMANESGGRDNVTVIIISVQEMDYQPS